MIVEVTQKHIDNAKPGCLTCPIALALLELFPNEMVSVGYGSACINENIITLPLVASKFAKSFDQGVTVNPISFEIPNLGSLRP